MFLDLALDLDLDLALALDLARARAQAPVETLFRSLSSEPQMHSLRRASL